MEVYHTMSSFSDFILKAFNDAIPYISDIERFRKVIESVKEIASDYSELEQLLNKFVLEYDVTFKTDVKIYLNVLKSNYLRQ